MLLRSACFAILAGVVCLSGCASPRLVQANADSVIVAVPEQSNSLPMHYQDEARKTAQQYLTDPVLVSTNQVKVGETVTNNQDTNRRDISPGKKKIGELTTTTSTTSVKDEYEYYLEFRPRNPGRQSPAIQQTSGTSPARQ